MDELAAAYSEKKSRGMEAAGASRAGHNGHVEAVAALDRPQCGWQRQVCWARLDDRHYTCLLLHLLCSPYGLKTGRNGEGDMMC